MVPLNVNSSFNIAAFVVVLEEELNESFHFLSLWEKFITCIVSLTASDWLMTHS